MLALWWIKRDFRLDDNPALYAALTQCTHVVPVYFLEPRVYLAQDASAFHLHAQLCALTSLQDRLRSLGAQLLILPFDLPQGFAWLHQKLQFTHIFSHEETGADVTFCRDKGVAAWCSANQILWCELPQSSVVRRLQSRDFRQQYIADRLLESTPIEAPPIIPQPDLGALTRFFVVPALQSLVPHFLDSRIQWGSVQHVSEPRAWRALDSFMRERGIGYRGGISSPNKAFFYGSRLSPHIAWGTISLRRVFSQLQSRLSEIDTQLERDPDNKLLLRWQKSLESFSSRLFWRDHFVQRLESESSMEFKALNPAYENLKYSTDPSHLQRWINGETGFPLVDACMRCLQATGFLNFRMRAMVVNFACFGLHVDWRELQYPLAKLFLDYEPGIHFSQIQMQAAIVGINSLRVYNPLKQMMEQDPDCQFIKRWIPELRRFSPEQIALHSEMPLTGYIAATVDADKNIRLMKDQIAAIRKSDHGHQQAQNMLQKHGSRMRRKRSRKPSLSIEQSSQQLELFDQHGPV